MLKLLRQYPAASLTGAVAAAGAASRFALILLDWRDLSRRDAVVNMQRKVAKIELPESVDELREAARKLAGAASWGDHDWHHPPSWTRFDGWASARTTNAAAHELEQASQDLEKFVADEIREVLNAAVKVRQMWDCPEAIPLADTQKWEAAQDYVDLLREAPDARKLRELGDVTEIRTRLEQAKATVENLEEPEAEQRDAEWARWLFSVGLVCFSAAITRDLR